MTIRFVIYRAGKKDTRLKASKYRGDSEHGAADMSTTVANGALRVFRARGPRPALDRLVGAEAHTGGARGCVAHSGRRVLVLL